MLEIEAADNVPNSVQVRLIVIFRSPLLVNNVERVNALKGRVGRLVYNYFFLLHIIVRNNHLVPCHHYINIIIVEFCSKKTNYAVNGTKGVF